jgi:hypothetical protein
MTPVLIEFLVGLFFVVSDSPALLAKPLTLNALFRFLVGVVLVVLAFMHISLV